MAALIREKKLMQGRGIRKLSGQTERLQRRRSFFRRRGVLRLEEYIKKELAEGRSLAGLAEKLWSKKPEVVLVSCEVGCGVVPVTPQERAYRETVGRCAQSLPGTAAA